MATAVARSDRSATVAISLARNEKESFQVLVLPANSRSVVCIVRVNDLRAQGGALFAATNVAAVPVGYVETQVGPALRFLTGGLVARSDPGLPSERGHGGR